MESFDLLASATDGASTHIPLRHCLWPSKAKTATKRAVKVPVSMCKIPSSVQGAQISLSPWIANSFVDEERDDGQNKQKQEQGTFHCGGLETRRISRRDILPVQVEEER